MDTKKEKFLRQRDVLLPGQTADWPTVVVGAGGIGSWAAFIAAKLGLTELVVYDFDKVEAHNLPSQFYRETDIGKAKVKALADNIKMFTDVSIGVREEKFDIVPEKRIAIIAVDSIKERARILGNYENVGFFPDYLIDARMGLEQMEIYVCRNPLDWASSFPVNLDNIDHDPCTARSIVYNTAVIGGMIGSVLKKIINGENYPRRIIFDLHTYMIVV